MKTRWSPGVGTAGSAPIRPLAPSQVKKEYEPGDVGPVEVVRGGERLGLEVTYDVLHHGR